MKIKSQLTLATLIVAGMFAAGCQQMQQTAGGSQQTASQQAAETTTTETVTQDTGGQDANYHCHDEAPTCATKCHSHPGATPGHKHVYGCVAGQHAPMIPKVKAKGNYKGAVMMDPASKAAMQSYQQ